MRWYKALKNTYGKRKYIAVLLLLSVGICSVKPTELSASALNNAQKKKNEAQENLDEINEQIKEIQTAQNSLQAEMEGYDEQLMAVLTDMEILKEDMDTQALEIEQAQSDLANAQMEARQQYEAMKVRIQYMYENSDQSVWTTIVGASSMTELLNRVEYVSDVYEYDRKLLTDYEEVVQEVEELSMQLEDEMAEMEMLEIYYEEQQASLEQIIAQKEAEMADFESKLTSAQSLASQYANTIKQQNQIIEKEKAKQKKQAESTNKSSTDAGTSGTSMGTATGGSSSTGLTDGGLNPSYRTGVSGSDVVAYASQFLGNPYVLGGTSLTEGADCSYFVMAVYQHFGISVPRTSYEQRNCGQAVSYENAKPGDIICYSGHVAIYIGNGKIIHASNPRTGICYGNATYRTIVAVRRVL